MTLLCSGLEKAASSSKSKNSNAVTGSAAAQQSRHQSQYEYVEKDPEFMGRDGDKVMGFKFRANVYHYSLNSWQ